MAQHTSIQTAPTLQSETPGCSRDTLETRLLIFLALCAVNFVANFLLFSDFGFYEDDYLFSIPTITWLAHDWRSHVISTLLTWPQGRPICSALQSTLFFLIGRGKSIWPFYCFVFGLMSCVAFSIFIFLRRFANTPAAFLAAILYLLFPADTAKQIVMHQMYFGLTLLLAIGAFTFYHKGKPLIAYILAAAILLNYEPYFLLLFFLPALKPQKDWKEMLKELLLNSIILALMFVSVLFIRKCIGDSRAADVMGHSLPTYLLRAAKAPWIGTYTALTLCFTRAAESLLHATVIQRILSVFSAGMIAMVSFTVLKTRADPKTAGDESGSDGLSPSRVQLIVTGLAMFMFVYIYRFYPDYYPPHINIGRLSALHSVGLIGLCISLGTFIDWIVIMRPKVGFIVIALMAIYYGLLVGFALEVQETQYVRNWKQQKKFLEDIVNQIGDLRADDAILVNIESGIDVNDHRPRTEGFPAFWMVNYPCNIFPQLLATPAGWNTHPNLFGFWNAAHMEQTPAGLFIGTPPYWTRLMQPIISSGKFLLFEWSGGTLKRSRNPIQFEGKKYFPREASPSSFQRFPTTKLYDILFNTDQRPLWPVFIDSRNYPS